ncbi:MAG: geranylgeranylglyceryl/heptaprenylglyceryl phosphate synthase [Thermoplasmatota archaeon]
MSGVRDLISKRLERGPVHVTLIDPDKQGPERSASLASHAQEGGTDILLIGGTTGVNDEKLGTTISAVKAETSLPIIIFPTSHQVLSPDADAVFYMSLMNSRNLDYVIREAARGSLRIAEMGLEAIPVGYIVVEPGMTVGEVGDVDLIPRSDTRTAMEYAKAAELFGMDFCYLEGGSGVSEPIPYEMIRSVRSILSIPIILGGGINSPQRAFEAVKAGADVIVTGTFIEREKDLRSAVSSMTEAMGRAWKER